MLLRTALVAGVSLLITSVAAAQPLLIDFNSLTQSDGPNPQDGYQAYDAGHEVADDFVTMQYAAFGTTVSLTPAWPDTSTSLAASG